MSPRRARRRPDPARPGPVPGSARRQTGRDGVWLVRDVSGANADKPYRCPGCDHLIGVGLPHVVVWPDDIGGAEHRRHWHRGCWVTRRPGGYRGSGGQGGLGPDEDLW